MIKITKFGGSSVANAQQFRKVRNIIESDPAPGALLSSAPPDVSTKRTTR